jgi:cystathionine gamma-synthase
MSARCTATAAVRAGIDSDAAFGAVVPPIVLSSNFSFEGFNQKRKYDYTRSGNPDPRPAGRCAWPNSKAAPAQ